jgi:hypothetical protein
MKPSKFFTDQRATDPPLALVLSRDEGICDPHDHIKTYDSECVRVSIID